MECDRLYTESYTCGYFMWNDHSRKILYISLFRQVVSSVASVGVEDVKADMLSVIGQQTCACAEDATVWR